jgi:hypothetical protein
MSAIRQKQLNPEASQRRLRLRWNVLLGDLSLLISLTVARLIIWRIIRARQRERALRLRNLRVINGGGQPLDSKKATAPKGVYEKVYVARSGA